MASITASIPRLLMLTALALAVIAALTLMSNPGSAAAQEPIQDTDAAPTEAPAPAATPTPPGPTPASLQGAFRIGPTVSLRPVNDVISFNQDGLVEVLFRNPALNDSAMEVELSVSVPRGFHLYGQGMASDVAAGTASATYVINPGHSRTIFLSVKADKVARSTIHFSGHFWPQGNKDLFNPISLTHPFTVITASNNPMKPPSDPTGEPAGSAQDDGGPTASCALGSMANGDLTLLSLGLLGITGLVFVRRPR